MDRDLLRKGLKVYHGLMWMQNGKDPGDVECISPLLERCKEIDRRV